MEGNPHYNRAEDANWESVDAYAAAQATLALAFEQRTANLIALATAQWSSGNAMFPEASTGSARAEIKERLGLK